MLVMVIALWQLAVVLMRLMPWLSSLGGFTYLLTKTLISEMGLLSSTKGLTCLIDAVASLRGLVG